MNKVKIGIIGTGVGIRTHYKGFLPLDGAEVIAICGSSLARSKEFAAKYNIPVACSDYKELCDMKEIDLVCVTTPNRLHKEAVEYAIKRRKHIICEKPLSDRYDEIWELSEMVKGYEKIVVVDHQLRYNPYILKIKDIIEAGKLGKIYSVKLNQQGTGFANPNAEWNWSFDGEAAGGVRYAMASHFTDLIQFWFDSPKVVNVLGYLNPVTKKRNDKDGASHEVSASTICDALINFENELSVQYSINAGSYLGSRFDIKIFGDEGELTFSLEDKISVYYRSQVGVEQKIDVSNVFDDEKQNKVSIFSGSFRYFAPLIIKAIQESKPEHIFKSTSFFDYLYNIEILDAIQRSANDKSSKKYV